MQYNLNTAFATLIVAEIGNRMFPLCPAGPGQVHSLVELKQAVQVHLHPTPPSQSVSTITAGETRQTSADHHFPSREIS